VPTYGYRCTKCGHQFEVFQRMSDEPIRTCPKCEGEVTKILYPSGVLFKGSGYYSTDYKGSGSSASSNGSGSTTESKPEAKPESKSDSSD
jgi:putative FmdB family regulatory protein